MNLYVIATPIGNLEDITIRALNILKIVDFIVCEDTRVTKRLLENYQISKPLFSYHQHSGERVIEKIKELLKADQSIAYLSDAGTPGISDPGGKLVETLVKEFDDNLKIIPLPGPSAILAALSVSGFPTDSFLFLGFVPNKKGRQTYLKQIAEQNITVVCYESVYRIEKFLNEIDLLMPKRKLMLGRELTKKFECLYRGYPHEILVKLKNDKVKGEFVIVFAPANFK